MFPMIFNWFRTALQAFVHGMVLRDLLADHRSDADEFVRTPQFLLQQPSTAKVGPELPLVRRDGLRLQLRHVEVEKLAKDRQEKIRLVFEPIVELAFRNVKLQEQEIEGRSVVTVLSKLALCDTEDALLPLIGKGKKPVERNLGTSDRRSDRWYINPTLACVTGGARSLAPAEPAWQKADAVAVDLTVEHVAHEEVKPGIPHAFTPVRLLMRWVPP